MKFVEKLFGFLRLTDEQAWVRAEAIILAHNQIDAAQGNPISLFSKSSLAEQRVK